MKRKTLNLIMHKLFIAGLGPEIIAKAKTGSVYIKFIDDRLGKLRVADHNEREKYGYKWQLRTDIDAAYVDNSKGHNRFFYPVSHVDNFIIHITNYFNKIQRR